MNTLQKLDLFQKSIYALSHLPLMELQQNKELLAKIKNIVSVENVNSIMNGLIQETQFIDNYPKDPLTHSDSIDFIKSYVNLQNVSFDIFRKNSSTKEFHSKLSHAMNAGENKVSKTSILKSKQELKKTKEAVQFKEVYNSIFSDHALQIGTQNDPTFIQSYIDYSPYIFNYVPYLSIPTLADTIDRPIKIALKKKPIIDFENDELDKYFKNYMDIENILDKLKRFIFYSVLSPRGSLIVPTIDKKGHVKIGVYNDTQFTYSVAPQYSFFNTPDNEYSINSVYLLGKILRPGVSCHFYCPGFEPLFGIGKNKMIPLKNAAEAINIYLYTIKVLCIRAQVMVQKWSGDGQTDSLLSGMKKMSEQINSRLSLNTAVKLPEGADLTLLNNNLSEGFAKISPIIKEFQAINTGVAPDYLYGSDTAYSANNFNIQMSHQNIEADILSSGVEPALRFIINSCLRHDVRLKQFSDLENEFEIKFENLYTPTGQEKVNEDKGKIENIILMSQYPELEEIFKKENLFPKDSKLPGVEKPEST